MYLQYNAVFRLLQVSLRVCTAIAFWCFLSTEVSSQPRVLRLIPYCRCAALDLRLVKSIAVRCFVVFWSLSSGQAFLCRLVRERDLRLGWGIDIGEVYFSLHYFNINVSDAPTDPQEVFLCIPFQIHCNVSVRRGLKWPAATPGARDASLWADPVAYSWTDPSTQRLDSSLKAAIKTRQSFAVCGSSFCSPQMTQVKMVKGHEWVKLSFQSIKSIKLQ